MVDLKTSMATIALVLAVALRRRPARDVAMMVMSFENASIVSKYIRALNAKR